VAGGKAVDHQESNAASGKERRPMPLSFDVESGAPVQEDDKRCRFGAGRFEQFSTELAVALSIDEFAQPSAAPGFEPPPGRAPRWAAIMFRRGKRTVSGALAPPIFYSRASITRLTAVVAWEKVGKRQSRRLAPPTTLSNAELSQAQMLLAALHESAIGTELA